MTVLGDSAIDVRANGFTRMLHQLGVDTAYTLIGFPVAIASFVLLITGLSLGTGLLITLVGLPILTATMFIARGFADLHRVSLRRVLHQPVPRPHYQRAPANGGWLRRVARPLADGQSWLDYAAGVLDLIFATIAFSFTVTWWSGALTGVTYGLYDWAIPRGNNDGSLPHFLGLGDATSTRIIMYSAIGLFFLVTLPFVIRGVTLIRARVARGLLCGVAEMRNQITGLQQRNAGLQEQKQAAASAEATALRRLERDIHDGPQQRLVRLAMDLGRARQQMDTDPEAARLTIDEALGATRETLDELRALSRGIAPPILTDRGLPSALAALAGRNPVPVDLAIAPDLGRLDPGVETTAYFVAAEALANVAKHSGASTCTVTVARSSGRLGVVVADDGVGGANVAKGHGLAGLADRVRASGGTLQVTSPAGGPTEIRAELPCG